MRQMPRRLRHTHHLCKLHSRRYPEASINVGQVVLNRFDADYHFFGDFPVRTTFSHQSGNHGLGRAQCNLVVPRPSSSECTKARPREVCKWLGADRMKGRHCTLESLARGGELSCEEQCSSVSGVQSCPFEWEFQAAGVRVPPLKSLGGGPMIAIRRLEKAANPGTSHECRSSFCGFRLGLVSDQRVKRLLREAEFKERLGQHGTEHGEARFDMLVRCFDRSRCVKQGVIVPSCQRYGGPRVGSEAVESGYRYDLGPIVSRPCMLLGILKIPACCVGVYRQRVQQREVPHSSCVMSGLDSQLSVDGCLVESTEPMLDL